MHALIITTLFAGPPALPPERSHNVVEPESTDEDRLAEVKRLYDEGTILYESADYEGAVKKFTDALAVAGNQASIRQSLLYNIGLGHENQFTVDQDVTHLRQALVIYKKYRTVAHEQQWNDDAFDVEARIATIENQLRVYDQIQRARSVEPRRKAEGPPPPLAGSLDDQRSPDRDRKTGIGLVVAGSMATVGGVILSIVGSQLEPRALDLVNELADMGVPADHPAWAEGREFVEQERAKGRAMLGTGVAVAVVGAVGVGVGSYYLVRAKRARLSMSPAVDGKTAGIVLSGRF
jgi:hypothetical protein